MSVNSCQIIPAARINRERWQQMLSEGQVYEIAGDAELLDILHPSWEALIYGDYEAALVVPVRRKVIRYAYNPLFVRQCGVYGPKAGDPAVVKSLLEFLHRRIPLIRIVLQLQVSPENLPGTFAPRTYQAAVISALTYTENTSRDLKKATKAGLTIKNIPVQDMVAVYCAYISNKMEEAGEEEYRMLEKGYSYLVTKGWGRSVAAVDGNGTICAVGMFSFFDGTITYLNGAVTDTGKNLGASKFLIDRVVHEEAGSFTQIDFGGSNIEGVARFYRSMGGTDRRTWLWDAGKWLPVLKLLKVVKV